MGQPEQNTNNQNEIGGLFLWQQTDQLEIILEWEQLEVDRRYIIRQWTKRDSQTGKFMDVKTSSNTPFKGVRKEK